MNEQQTQSYPRTQAEEQKGTDKYQWADSYGEYNTNNAHFR